MADKTMNVKVLHVTKTTAEWAAVDTVISKGLLCVEFATGGKVLAKVGDGVKTFAALPYLQDGTIDISNYSTTEQVNTIVDNKISALGNILTFKGVVATVGELPNSGQEVGDVWFVGSQTDSTDDFEEYVWAENDWEYIGRVQTEVDLSGYVQTGTFETAINGHNTRIEALEGDTHTHTNKAVLDGITAVESALSDTSTNPVQTKVVKAAIDAQAKDVSDLSDAIDTINNTTVPGITGRLDDLEADTHTHANKGVLDATTASFTTEQATKLEGIETGANKTVVDEALSDTSTNPVQNKAVKAAIDSLNGTSHTHDNKAVLDGITAVDTALSDSSTNPVQNKAVKAAIDAQAETVSDLSDAIDTINNTTVPGITGRLDTLEGVSHSHTNASVLNATTASFTTEQATKLEGIETGANKTIVDEARSTTSTNPVQNKVIDAALTAIETKVNTLEGSNHTHANKTVLDGITAVDTALSDTSTNPVQNKAVKAAIDDIDGRVDDLEADTHTHDNKAVLDATTASFTTEQKTKLAGIEDGANQTIVDLELNGDSQNPIANDAVYKELSKINLTLDDLEADTHTHDNKAVLDGITAVDTALSDSSTNPVQNKAVKAAVDGIDGRVAAIEADYIKSTDTLILNCTL